MKSDYIFEKHNEHSTNRRVSKFLDPFLVIGISISVALALFLVLIGVDKVDSLIVGLIATTLTLIIDLMARLKDNEERVIQATALGNLLIEDSGLFATVHQLLHSYQAVKTGWFDLFAQRADDALLECKDTIQALASGYMTAEPAGKFAIGKKGIEMAQCTVKAVSYEPLDIWKSPHWQGSFQPISEAIRRGVRIMRVFVCDKNALSKSGDILEEHQRTGEDVFVVSPQDLPRRFLRSYIVVDDRILGEFYLTLEGHLKEERISINPVEVDKAINEFDSILRRAQKYEKASNPQ